MQAKEEVLIEEEEKTQESRQYTLQDEIKLRAKRPLVQKSGQVTLNYGGRVKQTSKKNT